MKGPETWVLVAEPRMLGLLRQELPERVLDRLEREFPDLVEATPELLAHHSHVPFPGRKT